jgi:hypothetical protein
MKYPRLNEIFLGNSHSSSFNVASIHRGLWHLVMGAGSSFPCVTFVILKVMQVNLDPVPISEYRKTVNGYEIQAFFEDYIDRRETFLKNAMIITKK